MVQMGVPMPMLVTCIQVSMVSGVRVLDARVSAHMQRMVEPMVVKSYRTVRPDALSFGVTREVAYHGEDDEEVIPSWRSLDDEADVQPK